MQEYIDKMNEQREHNGYKTIEQLFELAQENTIYDLYSVLISKNVRFGKGNVIYPNVLIECTNGVIIIGDNNKLFSGTNIQVNGSEVKIGSSNEIGENGCSIQTTKGITVIKNECRLKNNAQIMDNCTLGDGAQVLGCIKVLHCILGDGQSYKGKDPNERGGVLKGQGIAKGLTVKKGEVINGNGEMSENMIERQEQYHPNWKNEEPK